MSTENLIVRRNIDGQEMVCLAPWFLDMILKLFKKQSVPEKTLAEKYMEK